MKLHCNRTDCQATFEADATASSRFCGGHAVRTSEFVACPICGCTDSQWIYAADIAPAFTGSAYQQREQLRRWTQAN